MMKACSGRFFLVGEAQMGGNLRGREVWGRRCGGFLLLECMLAVAVLAIGVLALGRCVENCIRAEGFRRQEALAQRALANFCWQIESGAIPLAEKATYPLKGAWDGMKMNVYREPLQLQNEKEQELFGLYSVKLQLVWEANNEQMVRELNFIIYPRQR